MRKPIQLKLLTSCVLASLGLSMHHAVIAAPSKEASVVSPIKNLTKAQLTSLSLTEVLEKVLLNSPQLRLFPHDLRMADAMAMQAGLTPNARLSLSVDSVLGTGQMSGVSGAETSLKLSQVIELGSKRQRRLDYVDAQKNVLNADYEKQRIAVLADATQGYYQVVRLSSLVTWLDNRIEVEVLALAKSQQLAKAGAVIQADISKLALGLARTRLEAKQLNNQLMIAKLQLAANWLEQGDIGALQGSLSGEFDYPDLQQVLAAIETAPDYLALLSEEGVRAAKLRLAQANGEVNIDTGVGIKRNETMDDTGLILSLSMPLNLTNPNQGNILAAKVNSQKLLEQQQLLRVQLRLSLTQTYQSMVNRAEEARAIQGDILPQAEKLLADTQAAYEVGQANVLQLADAQSQLFSLQRALIEANYHAFSQLLTLERITGQSLTSKSDSLVRVSRNTTNNTHFSATTLVTNSNVSSKASLDNQELSGQQLVSENK